jgi:hypothetical protein
MFTATNFNYLELSFGGKHDAISTESVYFLISLVRFKPNFWLILGFNFMGKVTQ